ncbi:hypothetical protein LF41_111 [Lysobacter dokdonensis DS-58]|uniref:DUF2272 domain-containing protein n=1 Tax=Lysobacter dokdonensis DS-58 TaxID=1300345 RepID=A0A0A2WFP5_9GAMM|nr:DUF2272 domain-containing protein [Lysobacter dokdonensis]KGQ19021.1 hypothetical protein LF41_111 [Lysobacter dokdonensis DS-58]
MEVGVRKLLSSLLLLVALVLAGMHEARAGEPCDVAAPPATTWGQRVAAVACAESRLWYSPFLDDQGRLASIRIAEAENSRLQDGSTTAWRRVVDYWKATGLLSGMAGHMGASECGMSLDLWPGSAACRAFVIDTPWSAVFVSFAYIRAGVPGFAPSASHFDFVRQALKGGADAPLRFADIDTEAPAVGDLLCFTRGNGAPLGPAGIRAYASRSGDAIAMHCDIVVSIDNGKLYAVGGNVLQGVTMRTLHVNRTGALWNLPHKGAMGAVCSPGASAGCTFNRQDWVALLKLEPKASAPPPMPATQCCTLCPLPMPANMQRCPVQQKPVAPQAVPATP